MKEATGQEPWEGIIKYLFKRKITANLGEVIETEDKIFVYVDKKKIKNRKHYFEISCSGIYLKDKEKARKYNLDKPICYILKNLEFTKPLSIYGHQNCEIIIENCIFNKRLALITTGDCTIEDTTINNSNSTVLIMGKKVKIKNTTIKNNIDNEFDGIDIETGEQLEINNSYFECPKGIISIKTKSTLELINSYIKAKTITTKSKSLISGRKTWLEASKEVDIEHSSFNEITILSPRVKSNDSIFKNLTKPVILKRVPNKLRQKRLELLRYLNSLKDTALENIQEERVKVTQELSNKPITKVLSKDN